MKQSEADTELLSTALDRGYFRVPRETTLVALAEEHDISDVEASERLRVGIEAVLRDHLDEVDAAADTDSE